MKSEISESVYKKKENASRNQGDLRDWTAEDTNVCQTHLKSSEPEGWSYISGAPGSF